MKKLFVAVVLVSVTAACGAKKADTTPSSKPPVDQKTDAGYGGATYGGHGHAPTPAANPCSSKAP